jgi:thiol:disulfide interchange protein
MRISGLVLAAAAGGMMMAGTAQAHAQMMSAAPAPQQPGSVHIYDVNADAKADVAAAIKKAHAEHKRVILDFGGNWCGDCRVLDINFHKPENQEMLKKYYVLVDIDIGREDKNLDLAKQFGVPLDKGVPALSVLDGHGKVVYSQTKGEFEDMRHMDPASVHEFLEQWKPKS